MLEKRSKSVLNYDFSLISGDTKPIKIIMAINRLWQSLL